MKGLVISIFSAMAIASTCFASIAPANEPTVINVDNYKYVDCSVYQGRDTFLNGMLTSGDVDYEYEVCMDRSEKLYDVPGPIPGVSKAIFSGDFA